MKRNNFKCPTCGINLPVQIECYKCRKKKMIVSITPESALPSSVPKILVKQITSETPCNLIIEGIPAGQTSFFIHGPSGSGKSFQAAVLMYRVSRETNKYQVDWMNVPQFLFDIRQGYNKGNQDNEQQMFERYSQVPWLVMDDLGAEKMSDWVGQILYLIINSRYENEKTTIITSNLSIAELTNKMEDDRIPSRISGMCEIVETNGNDRRRK